MKWIPPWSYADRLRWFKEHVWLGACYFATVMSVLVGLVMPALTGSTTSLGFRLVLALALWPVTMLFTVIGVRHRWGERPDADDQPEPTPLRPWSTASDRLLAVFFWLGVVGVLLTVLDVATGSGTAIGALVTAGCSLALALTTWQERWRRRNTH